MRPNTRFRASTSGGDSNTLGRRRGLPLRSEGFVQVVPAEQGQAPVPVRAMGYDGHAARADIIGRLCRGRSRTNSQASMAPIGPCRFGLGPCGYRKIVGRHKGSPYISPPLMPFGMTVPLEHGDRAIDRPSGHLIGEKQPARVRVRARAGAYPSGRRVRSGGPGGAGTGPCACPRHGLRRSGNQTCHL